MFLEPGDVVYLRGELGTGKTAFARAIIQQRGSADSVTSPTFTLIETYHLDDVSVVHLDLYRIESDAQMEGIGLRDYLDGRWICLIEWPDRAPRMLPDPDLTIDLAYEGKGRSAVLIATKQLSDRADWLK
ncbi:uncharacterized protein METZ01_LOCUS65115 [marine metagenome]|uniref:tRNA threonylcarbamoyladenosine biosynthesis protein TsaE n=1 Tax=marine metagenome TaxID=408172 RepID=A0A381T9Q4_9ZZZZ